MLLPAHNLVLAITLTALWNPRAILIAATDVPLTFQVQSYLRSQGLNASIPASALAQGLGNLSSAALSCGILNFYRDGDLVTAQDGQVYTTEAEQHWYFRILFLCMDILEIPWSC